MLAPHFLKENEKKEQETFLAWWAYESISASILLEFIFGTKSTCSHVDAASNRIEAENEF